MKSDSLYKKAFNHALELLEGIETGAEMPTENQMAERLDISRTTVRKVLGAFQARGLVSTGLPRIKLRSPGSAERYPDAETVPISAQVEKNFMQWILKDDRVPGR